MPKRDKPVTRTLTQEEMLAEATITEQTNIASLETWQQMEAERMAKAKRREKQGIIGPFIRYYSYTDGEESERPRKKRIMLIEQKEGKNVVQELTDKNIVDWMEREVLEKSDMIGRNLIYFEGDPSAPHNGVLNGRRASNHDTTMWDQEEDFDLSNLSDGELDRTDLIPALTPWLDKEPRPMLPILCPITAKVACYKDPATGVPFADATAFRTLRQCLDHSIVWSEVCNAFVTMPGQLRGAKGVPEGWERMTTGKLDGQSDWMIGDQMSMPDWLKKLRGISTEDQPDTQLQQPSTDDKPAEADAVIPPENLSQTASSPTSSRRTRSRPK